MSDEKKSHNTAGVHVLDLPYHADIEYSYRISPQMRDEIGVGSFVFVPFGRSNKLCPAVVTSLYSDNGENKKIKTVGGIYSNTVISSLTSEMLGLCYYMKETCFCTIGDAVKTMLPTGTLARVDQEYFACPNADLSELGSVCFTVYQYIMLKCIELKDGHGVYIDELKRKFGNEVENVLEILLANEVITREYRMKGNTKTAVLEYIELANPCDDEMLITLSRSPKQKEIVKYLRDNGSCSIAELREKIGATRANINSLVEKKCIRVMGVDKYRTPYELKSNGEKRNDLTEEQSGVAKTIIELCDSGEPKAALLHGVTGSGKTRVMKNVIDHVISKGKSVIVLVPEISLTPQTVGLFSSFYGNEVAVIHSSLSNGERFDEWRRMHEGKAKICIGTRSAVFAPFKNIGLIIIDEEQEHTYKSDMSPRYHAKDIARYRCAAHKAVMLLSSATPSVESYYKAITGSYTLCKLKHRYSGTELPKAVICDMRGVDAMTPYSDALLGEIKQNAENNEQTILFVNRRGYSNFASCQLCGEVIKCPSCSVSLTYHTKNKSPVSWQESLSARIENGFLVCHYCGFKSRVPDSCPSCASKTIKFMGYGTQYAEKTLQKNLPNIKTVRVDADTTGSKFAFDSILEKFRRKEQDIMLGTQMVTKGHDFPDVTLVGVVNADAGLYMSDYRAAERTFSLIAQVIGRAGRANKEGRAVIQSYTPDNPTLLLAAKQDYEGFYENEIALRHALVFPPFCDLAVITISSEDENTLANSTDVTCVYLKELLTGEYKDVKMQIFGPMEAPIYKIREKMRMKIIMKCKSNKRTREMLSKLIIYSGKKSSSNVTVSLDMNPSSI